ncbi:permease [Corynebacterium aquilae]|uniref:Permease n=1 Tax=Corynebacterium aquilae DSM 44791 TaxID=1431546 RepID=A0A1L7CI79_9CORY|nr:permease [Corynebacterium aquilae]APT85566.1 hypothetical protein CAQU_11505 [Corynebacterium aquilae DSM 44791]
MTREAPRHSAPLADNRFRAPAQPAVVEQPVMSVRAAIIGAIGCILILFFARTPISDRGAQWSTIVVSLVVQAFPLVVLGSVLSAAVSAYLPPHFLQRILPAGKFWTVPAAAGMGVFLPTCECASVPIASGLVRRGLSPAAGIAFMLAAPGINPLVVISTYLAYQATPMVAVARFAAGFVAACAVAFACRRALPASAEHCEHHHHRESFGETFIRDVLRTTAYLVLGCMIAAALKVFIPAGVMPWHNLVLSVVAMMLLAMVMSICSEADAFVAASFTNAPLPAQLAFMVVGPMVDIKLVAMQWGAFGPKTTLRVVGLSVVAAAAATTVVSLVLF